MTHENYKDSVLLSDNEFYALIMAAMRRADTDNQRLLREAWPEVWDELQLRYNAPGGYTERELRALQERYDLTAIVHDDAILEKKEGAVLTEEEIAMIEALGGGPDSNVIIFDLDHLLEGD